MGGTKAETRNHITWAGLAALWLLALAVGIAGLPHSAGHAMLALFGGAFVLYLGGGLLLARLHRRRTAGFPTAHFIEFDGDEGHSFRIAPASRHLPFLQFALFGAVFLACLPVIPAGHGIGAAITLPCAAAFALTSLHPQLWRTPAPHGFSIEEHTITAAAGALPVAATQGFRIDTAVNEPRRMAAVATRHLRAMQARSHRITALTPGGNLLLAEGLDHATALALLSRIQALTTPAAARAPVDA